MHDRTPSCPKNFELRDDLHRLERWQRLDRARTVTLIACAWIVSLSLSTAVLVAAGTGAVWAVTR